MNSGILLNLVSFGPLPAFYASLVVTNLSSSEYYRCIFSGVLIYLVSHFQMSGLSSHYFLICYVDALDVFRPDIGNEFNDPP